MSIDVVDPLPYEPAAGWDEMVAPGTGVRAHWGYLHEALSALGPSELERRRRQVDRLLHDDGATYAVVLGASAGGRVAIDALPAGDVTVLGHGPVARDGATVEVPSLPAAAVTLRLA